MKKTITALLMAVMLAAVCLMSGCSLKKEKTPKPVITPEPAPTSEPEPTPAPLPQTTPATVLTDDLPATALRLDAGTEVEVDSESGEYYLCRVGDKKLYVEKRFVRLASEAQTERKGFIGEDTELFDDVYLSLRSKYTAEEGTEVTVFAEMDACVSVRFGDGTVCFARAEKIYDEDPSKKHVYSGFEPTDGGDIHLVSTGDYFISFLGGSFPAKGHIKADGVEAYYCFFYRGDLINIISVDNGIAEILYFDQTLTVPQKLIRGHDKPIYVAWEGYTHKDALIFYDYRMQTEPESAALNSAVVVLEKFDDCYYVELNGRRGFMPLESISESEVTASNDYYGEGSQYGDEGAEWTAPAL